MTDRLEELEGLLRDREAEIVSLNDTVDYWRDRSREYESRYRELLEAMHTLTRDATDNQQELIP